MEELHNQEMQKRKEMKPRQEEERDRREEEMMIRQREMEEQMRCQREECYSRMGCMDPRERDMRMGGGGAMNMGDPYGSGGQKFPALGGVVGIGYEANPGIPPATMSGSMMGSDMHTERFGQGAKSTSILHPLTLALTLRSRVTAWFSFLEEALAV
ncbi:hypothetical protein GH733_016189 [Mirounga leonina]|nr:hypothetical protein GH733_016189 [Mirounga leonina]